MKNTLETNLNFFCLKSEINSLFSFIFNLNIIFKIEIFTYTRNLCHDFVFLQNFFTLETHLSLSMINHDKYIKIFFYKPNGE